MIKEEYIIDELKRLEKMRKEITHLKSLGKENIIYTPKELSKEDKFILINCDKDYKWLMEETKLPKSTIYDRLNRFKKCKYLNQKIQNE